MNQARAHPAPTVAVELAWWFAATVLLSAFLLFQVQPIISKMILPWYGGSPAVWTTCMLFFQVLLLAGYTYAHLLVRLPRLSGQVGVHVLMLLAALLVLPITPDTAWKPAGGAEPVRQILLLLAAHVGLPFLVLAATAPLVQSWFARTYAGRSPYRLYALSNAGSLAALLTYPFVVEPSTTTKLQGLVWSLAFAAFALLCAGLGIVLLRSMPAAARRQGARPAAAPAEPEISAPGWYDRLLWLLLPVLACVMLLAVTNHLCQDVAVVPFLWVAPLSLYLLSFILCFDSPRWYLRRVYASLTTLLLLFTCAMTLDYRVDTYLQSWNIDWQFSDHSDSLPLQVFVFLSLLFCVCMLCHGEVVRRKPHSHYLTSFYLTISAGGALGGVLVAIVSPLVFRSYLELNLALLAAFLLAVATLWHDGRRGWLVDRMYRRVLAGAVAAVGFFVMVTAQMDLLVDTNVLVAVRDFYGILRVKQFGEVGDEGATRQLYHGRILHGVQFLEADRELEPTTYYNDASGVGVAVNYLPRERPIRVGVVGLGVGTMAAHGRSGDYYRFYEINPDVRDLATRYFTFLSETPAEVEIVLGDARVSLEAEQPQQFDLLVLDAFSGDAIPVHLLTREAFAVYQRHMRENGIIAVHTSNRYLELDPVVLAIAHSYDMQVCMVGTEDPGGAGDAASDWMLVTNNRQFIEDPLVQEAVSPLPHFADPPLWTDQYSNLFEILR